MSSAFKTGGFIVRISCMDSDIGLSEESTLQTRMLVAKCPICSADTLNPFNFCQACGPSSRGCSVPRTLDKVPLRINAGLLESRKAYKLAATAGRKGQQRKCAVADQFDPFMRARSNTRRGWATAVPMDILEWMR